MRHLLKWSAVRLGALATVLAVGTASIVVALTASPAQAGCHGSGPSAEFSLSINPGPILRERPYPYSGSASTCDGDDNYRGQLQDVVDGDGKCAWAIWWDPSQSAQGSQCTTGPWKTYNAWDQQGNSAAVYALCADWQCADPEVFVRAYSTYGF